MFSAVATSSISGMRVDWRAGGEVAFADASRRGGERLERSCQSPAQPQRRDDRECQHPCREARQGEPRAVRSAGDAGLAALGADGPGDRLSVEERHGDHELPVRGAPRRFVASDRALGRAVGGARAGTCDQRAADVVDPDVAVEARKFDLVMPAAEVDPPGRRDRVALECEQRFVAVAALEHHGQREREQGHGGGGDAGDREHEPTLHVSSKR